MPIVVAGRELLRADVELAVLVFAEAFRARHDHGADRIGPGDMAVVIDLDAARRPRQREGLGQRFQEPLLRGRIGKLARQRLARIGQRVLHQFLALAALRHRDLDLVFAFGGKRRSEQRAFLEFVRHQNTARRRFVVVELRQKRAQHFAGPSERSALGK